MIDSDELIKATREYFEYYTDFCDFVKLIDQAPTVDQWHYPSKGEFPPSGEEVLIRIDKKNYLGTYDGEVMWDIPLAGITCSGDWVDMWQYIIPPKEEA